MSWPLPLSLPERECPGDGHLSALTFHGLVYRWTLHLSPSRHIQCCVAGSQDSGAHCPAMFTAHSACLLLLFLDYTSLWLLTPFCLLFLTLWGGCSGGRVRTVQGLPSSKWSAHLCDAFWALVSPRNTPLSLCLGRHYKAHHVGLYRLRKPLNPQQLFLKLAVVKLFPPIHLG